MSPQEQTRLERVEKFVERLTLNSYLAKAADTGGRVAGDRTMLEPGEQDLAGSVKSHVAVTALEQRVRELEQLVRTLMATPTGTPVVQGEAVLAKAVSSFNDADSLLAYADTVITDPTVMGVVSGHLSAGDMLEAKRAVLEATERTQVAKAAGDMAQVVGAGTDDDLAGYDSRAATSEMLARFSSMERLLSSLEARLSQLEARPQAAAPVNVDDEQLVAKAAAPKRKRTPQETADFLTSQVDSYFDNPTTVGQLTSMIAAGQFKPVRAAVARAKQAHESARLVNERKGWS